MAKVAFMFVLSLVLLMSIHLVIGAEAPTVAGGWSPVADRVAGVTSPDDVDDNGSPTRVVDQIGQAAGPALGSMRGAGQAFASQASQAADKARKETVTWGDWLKHKLGAMNIFGGSNDDEDDDDESSAAAPSA